jgi:hypothetical protein
LVILECNEAFENGIVPVERTDQRPRPVADLILETDFAGRGPLQRPVGHFSNSVKTPHVFDFPSGFLRRHQTGLTA